MAKKASKIVHVLTRDGSERPVDLMRCKRYRLQLQKPTHAMYLLPTDLVTQLKKGPDVPPPKYYYFQKPDFWFTLIPRKSACLQNANFDTTSHIDPESEDASFVEVWAACVARDYSELTSPTPAVLGRFSRQSVLSPDEFFREFSEWLAEPFEAVDLADAAEVRADRLTYILELRKTTDLSNKEIAAMASRQFGVKIGEKYVSKAVVRHNAKAKKGDRIPLKYKRRAK